MVAMLQLSKLIIKEGVIIKNTTASRVQKHKTTSQMLQPVIAINLSCVKKM